MDDTVTTTINFLATLYSDDPSIASRMNCDSITVLRPNDLEDMQIAYGSDSVALQKIASLKDSDGKEVTGACKPEYEIEFIPLHTYLKLSPSQTSIVLESPSVKQESLISYNTPEEATLIIRDKST